MNTIQIGSRSEFSKLEPPIYLNHAAISPPSQKVMSQSLAVLNSYARQGVGAVFQWIEQRESLRHKIAGLIHAQPEEIGLCSNTTSGLVHIAHLIPWKKGAKILLFKGEFPTNITPWQQAATRCSGELVFIDLDFLRTHPEECLQIIEKHLSEGIDLLACSAVQFQTGFQMPLEALGILCKKVGTLFAVDAIQACGIVPIDVQKMNVDFLSCGSHKWLMGLEGCGFVFVNADYFELMQAQTAGWLSHEDGLSFLFDGPNQIQYDRRLKKNASVVEHGAMNALGFAALETSLDSLIHLGISDIFDHVQAYHDRLETIFVSNEFVSYRAPQQNCRSGILSFRHPHICANAKLSQLFLDKGISCSTPDGYLRFSPHWPNSLEELDVIDRLLPEIVSIAR